jgi:hypothetical protein
VAEYEIPKFLRVPHSGVSPRVVATRKPSLLGIIQSIHVGQAIGLTRAQFRADKGGPANQTLEDVKAGLLAHIDRHIEWLRNGGCQPGSRWVSRRDNDYYISMKLGVIDVSVNGTEVFGPIEKKSLESEFLALRMLVVSGQLDHAILKTWHRVKGNGKSRKVPRGFYKAAAEIKFSGNEARCRNYYKANRDNKWADVERFERGEFEKSRGNAFVSLGSVVGRTT